MHPLALEDVLEVNQRPKVEIYGDTTFLITKLIYRKKGKLVFEHMCMLIGPTYVITFQETETNVLDPVRDRILGTKWRIRKLGSDYLGYALIDAIVDYYFSTLDELGNELDHSEAQVLSERGKAVLNDIYRLKRDLVLLRKTIWPLREIISRLLKSELFTKQTVPFLEDVHDHTVEIIETIETYREVSSSILETHLTTANNRMNEIMKVLTVISTIFIPLTFITGVYGMNFIHMPELAGRWSYGVVWLVMICVAGFMVRYFRKKHWF